MKQIHGVKNVWRIAMNAVLGILVPRAHPSNIFSEIFLYFKEYYNIISLMIINNVYCVKMKEILKMESIAF